MNKLSQALSAYVYPHLTSRLFIAILLLKLILATFFGGDVLVKGFIPFVRFFVDSGFQNPYDHFLAVGQVKAFPYSTVMLWFLAAPWALLNIVLPLGSETITSLHLLVARLPIFAADLFIYLALCNWLPSRGRRVELFYWASPMLLYINYFHGQLDVIPTSLLFASLMLLFAKRERLAMLLLGFGIATKTHLLAALPFYLVYLRIKGTPVIKLIRYISISLVAAAALLAPYLSSAGYQELVLKAEEQGRVFLLTLEYGNTGIALLLAPALYFVLLFRFSTFRKVTPDLFLVIVGLMFALLAVFVPPMPGWFYWSAPFLVYFYIKKPDAPTFSFWTLNGLFLIYFLFYQQSDFFRSFQVISSSIATLPNLYTMLSTMGIDSRLVSNLLFTMLEATLVMNIVWCYKAGVKDSYKQKTKPLLLGIGGNSGAGKTTFTALLTKMFRKEDTVYVHGDDAHRWPRGHENWQVFTHLDPRSNRLHQELEQAISLKAGHPIERVHYNHQTGAFTDPVLVEPNKVIIFEGLHSYYLKRMRDLFDLKIFIEPEPSLLKHWKVLRDTTERGYKKGAVLKQLASRESDASKFIQPQRRLADIVIAYEPLRPITKLGEPKTRVDLRLKITVENSLDLEPLVQSLAGLGTLSLEYLYEDADTISLVCCGEISAAGIKKAADRLIPDYQELTRTEPTWVAGLGGVIQLFLLYHLSEMLKLREGDD